MEEYISNIESFNIIGFDHLVSVANLNINILYARFMNSYKDSWNMENHRHSYYELHIPIEGEFDMLMSNNNVANIKKGRYIIIHPCTYHKFMHFSDNCIRLSLAFSIENKNGYTAIENYCFSHICSESVISNVKNMLDEYIKLPTGYETVISTYLQLILMDCVRSSLIYRKSNTETLPPVFQSAIKYINCNLLSDINVGNIAAHCNISSRHLNRVFKESIGMTVSQFIRKERIKIAKRHLCSVPRLALKEIAQLSGFSDEYVLSKVFLRETGISAKDYRKKYMSKKQ